MSRRPRIVRTRRSGLRRYLGDGETTMLVTRQHPFVLVRAAIDMLGLLLPLAIAAWGIAGTELLRGVVGTWLLRIIFALMLVLLARLALRVLAWELERVVVTDEKVIHVAGVLDKRIASTPLAKVSEFTVRQPLVGRIFDYGSLVVDVPGGRDQALHGLAYLPDPAGLYRLVSDQARRGRVHEGGGRLEDDPPELQAPTVEDIERIERIGLPDPWEPSLEGDVSDHTIRIPRVQPRSDD
ncbi:MAG: rane-flanked domain protein [Thermoleophilia bacterium]|nr:rane-flanked domain protein [Thermoleophilia bacterium]